MANKKDYGDGYNFQEVFFKSHPVNKKNPNPIPPKKEKPPEKPPEPQPKPEPQPQPRRIFIPVEVDDKKKKHSFLKFLIWLIIIAIFVSFGSLIFLISRIDYVRESPDEEMIVKMVGELEHDPDVQNILIFGTDNHPRGENGRSDSMILVSIDKKHQKIKQTSFLRDLYLPIVDKGEGRLNLAFSIGGAKLAVETIEYNFHIKIDSYITIDFESFESIIDGLGGIDIELTEPEIEYINWQSHKNKQVEDENELKKENYNFYQKDKTMVAVVHLNGRQALWHARNRGDEDMQFEGDDFTRTSKQRDVINTVLSKLQEANPTDLVKTVYKVAPMIKTNMDLGNALKLSFGVIGYLKYDRMGFRVPQIFNYSNEVIDGQEVLVISNMDETIKALKEFVFNADKEAEASSED